MTSFVTAMPESARIQPGPEPYPLWAIAAQLCVAADKGLAYARSLQLNA